VRDVIHNGGEYQNASSKMLDLRNRDHQVFSVKPYISIDDLFKKTC
jgi:hypothetical protein